ncbi:MAG: S8 family serine peptidase, partial [Armatimonadota bacterium]
LDGDSNGRFSGHGSTVSAIIDRSRVYPPNPTIFRQINLNDQDRRPTDVRVGIVDTGVSPFQFDLRAQIVAGASFVPGSPGIDDLPIGLDTNRNGVFDEGAGHGTIIAGLIAQIGPNLPLIIAKSADSDGVATPWSVLQGIEFCVENGAKVINVSLGSRTNLPGFAGFLDWVEESGSLIIAPIGNNGTFGSLYPAAYRKVVCVTGLDADNRKADFSNWDTVARVAAPALGLVGPWFDGGQANWSGTSLAASLVTGSLAVALGSHSSRSPGYLRYALTASGRDIDFLNPRFRGKLGKLLDFTNLSFFLRGD